MKPIKKKLPRIEWECDLEIFTKTPTDTKDKEGIKKGCWMPTPKSLSIKNKVFHRSILIKILHILNPTPCISI